MLKIVTINPQDADLIILRRCFYFIDRLKKLKWLLIECRDEFDVTHARAIIAEKDNKCYGFLHLNLPLRIFDIKLTLVKALKDLAKTEFRGKPLILVPNSQFKTWGITHKKVTKKSRLYQDPDIDLKNNEN